MIAIEVTMKNGKCEIVHPMLFKTFRILNLKNIKGWQKIEVSNNYFKFKIKEVSKWVNMRLRK